MRGQPQARGIPQAPVPPPVTAGIPPPPPPPPVGIPQPPPAAPQAVKNLPPAQNGRSDLLSQIRQGTGLKKADERQLPEKAPSSGSSGGREDMLAQIRGIKLGNNGLKPVSERVIDSEVESQSSSGGGGIADALKLALQKRDKTIHCDSDDSSNESDDSEWDD